MNKQVAWYMCYREILKGCKIFIFFTWLEVEILMERNKKKKKRKKKVA